MFDTVYTIFEAPIRMTDEEIWRNRKSNNVKILASCRNKLKMMKRARELKIANASKLEKNGKKIVVIGGVLD